MKIKMLSRIGWLGRVGLIGLVGLAGLNALAQQKVATPGKAEVNTSIADDGTGKIIVEAHGVLPKPPVYYTAKANATAQVGSERVEQTIQLSVKVIQGEAKTLSFGLNGKGEVSEVSGEAIQSWAVRQEGDQRFLDLLVKPGSTEVKAVVKVRSAELKFPADIELTHLTPGKSLGFDSIVNVSYSPGVEGAVTSAKGFVPLASTGKSKRFQTTTGGQINISLHRGDATPAPVELVDTVLKGTVHGDGKSCQFQLRGTAQVSKANAEITILSGFAAANQIPANANYRLRLSQEDKQPVYKLVFAKPGSYPVALDFVATVSKPKANWHSMDFTIAASAVVPLTLSGLDADLEFQADEQSVVPLHGDNSWLGFLPATGHARLQWKTVRKAGEGKLFFTTTALIEAKLGAGLLRQDHQIDYKVLQGELKALDIQLHGPGEILDVQGSNIVAWQVSGEGDQRKLSATLSQPITATSQVKVRSQTPLGAFPVRVEGLRLNPTGAIRHSGFVRLTNLGSVRLEPAGLSGLTQLAPEQFPGEPLPARQTFVYRFPAASYGIEVAADRIQPEVNVSELVLYELAETDRVIRADIELDIREAPIRERDFGIPADYSVVAVTGSGVADYIVASEAADGRRNLKVIFGQDVSGRQLVNLQLEKNEAAVAGDWVLPRIEYPGAKTARGDIGIVGAPGFRMVVGETNLLVEKPLSYFPKPVANLQQAFRIREPGWAATMKIELLDRSVQADVFHLYSLSEGSIYGSALLNYFVAGSPVSEWKITVPEALGNVMVEGKDVRTWRREGDTLIVSLHQAVMGAYTLLVTFEEKPGEGDGSFQLGLVTPVDAQGERGYIQVVSPTQVKTETLALSDGLLVLDPLELPAEQRLLSPAPPLGTWQYTARPFDLKLKVDWFQSGETVAQVVEFAEANSLVSPDGELVTEVLYDVKSRGQRTLKIQLPNPPVRLWSISVDGQPVTAKESEGRLLVPLPGGDPNKAVEVKLRFGKPSVKGKNPRLALPLVSAPILKTDWHIRGDEKHVLVPGSGTVAPPVPVLRPSGFSWVARRGTVPLILIGLLCGLAMWTVQKTGFARFAGIAALAVAVVVAFGTALSAQRQTSPPTPLQINLPILAAGEAVELQVKSLPLWQVNLSWTGLVVMAAGIAVLVYSLFRSDSFSKTASRCGGWMLLMIGILLQHDSAGWFFALFGLAIISLLLLPQTLRWTGGGGQADPEVEEAEAPGAENGTATALLAIAALVLSAFGSPSQAATAEGFGAADAIQQQWQINHQDKRLKASGTITLSGRPGDHFLLLKAPAVLTKFEGKGLRLSKRTVPGVGLAYIVSIPAATEKAPSDDPFAASDPFADEPPAGVDALEYKVEFEYQLEALKPMEGVAVPTGIAAVQEISLKYDEAGWDVLSTTAVRIEQVKAAAGTTQVKVLLGPGEATLFLKPKERDVTMEETRFFVEGSNLYLPGPGVVDGRHRLHVRTAQGQVSGLEVLVPKGLTVSEVSGPVGSWQFDADSGRLKLEIEPAQSAAFDVMIDTQRGLDPLPADLTLAPLKVVGANGEVGLLAIAFGADAQPEKAESETMSAVNLDDFDASLLPNKKTLLHRVYRFGAEGGEMALRVAPVDPEIRVTSKQKLSLGDERVVLGVNFEAEITRAGLFQLSFPLPTGLEVESLTGAALHHWAELSEDGQRRIILHLNGKTIGTQSFSLTLTGAAPTEAGDWEIPHFQIAEAKRQTGELVVKPTTGIRLRTVSRQNVSETDPRSLGGQAQGALAFRLLQRDWNLVIGIEKLDPWVTGQVLHEVTLREGQTRSALIANFDVQNASIRSLQVTLPLSDEGAIKTLRANGTTVSDLVRTAPDSDTWEIQFKRRVVGKIQFRIEYERRGERENESEILTPAGFPQARQLAYYFAVRVGGRLEIGYDALGQGWQRADWNTLPQTLREAGDRKAPALALRAVSPPDPLTIRAKRHSLAEALKLRVARGSLTTILSPTGDQLTTVDVTMEVIQRSSLSVGLPAGGELFSIFVNDESVHSIRQGDEWQFYILPGTDDRTAKVRFVYSVPGSQLRKLQLTSPQLNVPLENIEWNVVAPQGFVLTDDDGNLELKQQAYRQAFNRSSYLAKAKSQRETQAQSASQKLDLANASIQAGNQSKARWALKSVANQYALDAASNEDARVQLENLQRQQAVVGLNTIRQRVSLNNDIEGSASPESQQLKQAAAENQILQQGQMNFRPQQLSQLLQGNTTEDNAVLQQIAGQLVKHQRSSEPAPRAIPIILPEEGTVYTFTRGVQVAENAPLELDLRFGRTDRIPLWQGALLLALLAAIVGIVTVSVTQRRLFD